eukprot:GHVS01028296.1.p1 GENE.GHVS01028296.1~~GHVS01028296.1.p1  ORF type:complete len:262 (+),score=73.90 GHVS01028296.1:289-1074(+)
MCPPPTQGVGGSSSSHQQSASHSSGGRSHLLRHQPTLSPPPTSLRQSTGYGASSSSPGPATSFVLPSSQPATGSSTNKFNPGRYERPGLSLQEICEIREAFELFEPDGRGGIDPRELKSALLGLSQREAAGGGGGSHLSLIGGLAGGGVRNQVAYQLISDLDRYSSHSIGFDEFLDMMTARISGDNGTREDINKVFRLFDDDNTGSISFRKLQRVAAELGERLSEEELKEMITRADSDGDGYVTADDFYNIVSRRASSSFS